MNVLTCDYIESAKKEALPLVSKLNKGDKKQLWIIPQDAGGFGDISCALKIANFLVGKGYFSQENISIVSTKTEIVAIFNQYSLKVITPEAAHKIELASPSDLLKLVVPIRSYSNIDSTLLQGKAPYIVLWEYGVKFEDVPVEISHAPHLVNSFGLEKDEEGILVDQEMNDCSELSWEKRLFQLGKVSSVLRSAILGEGELENVVNEFINTSRLYFGYASQKEYFTKFLKAIVSYNHDNSKDLTFVFPVAEEKFFLPKYFKEVASIEVFVFDLTKETIRLKEQKIVSDKGRKIKVILGSLSGSDLKSIQLASRKETMATGDQSLSQVISAVFCRFIYEALPHKAELANSLNLLYPISPTLGVSQGKDLKAKDIQRFFEQCKEKKEQFSEVSRAICVNHNAYAKIPSLIEQVFKDSEAY